MKSTLLAVGLLSAGASMAPAQAAQFIGGDYIQVYYASSGLWNDGGSTTVVSDGSEERPYCTWSMSCSWDTATQDECAQKLCEASGYTTGIFVSGNDYCAYDADIVSGVWYWVVDTDVYVSDDYDLESAITASCGAANQGLQIGSSDQWRDVTYPGSPYSIAVIEYDFGGSANKYLGRNWSDAWTVVDESNLSSGTTNYSSYEWSMGETSELTVVKEETWDDADKAMLLRFTMINESSSTISNLRLLHGIDPDQGTTSFTYNDVLDLDSDGVGEWAESRGGYLGWTVGYGMCDVATQEVGHSKEPVTSPDPDCPGAYGCWHDDADDILYDNEGASWDSTVSLRHTVGTLAAGAETTFTFIFAWGTSSVGAQENYEDALPLCEVCDMDGDGYESDSVACGGTDCDDSDEDIYPRAYYRDVDSDGYGDAGDDIVYCGASTPLGYVLDATDCDDDVFAVNPAASEVCDTGDVDEDCDDLADDEDVEGAAGKTTTYPDNDGDGYGDEGSTGAAYCDPPAGDVSDHSDCDDADSTVNPAATEVCDASDVDEDCNDLADDADPGVTGEVTYHPDSDGDGYGDASTSAAYCDPPSSYILEGTDCDDSNSAINPAASEVCDPADVDEDCNGLADNEDADALGTSPYYPDDDGDGFGDQDASSIPLCDEIGGYVDEHTDCDDSLDSVYPGAVEIPYDGIDQDCDDADLCDVDGDGFDSDAMACGGDDCDDDDAAVNTAAVEVFYDGVDGDCDGWSDYDKDFDGYDSDAYGGEDCDDENADIYPGAEELVDGLDNDCDGYIETDDRDGDGLSDLEEWGLGSDPEDPDSDGDGLTDGEEVGDVADPTDSDEDGIYDLLDDDDDGDGLLTAQELSEDDQDPDGDGIVNHLDLDSDGDGTSDQEEGLEDGDCDSLKNYVDANDLDGPCVDPEVIYKGGAGCQVAPGLTMTGAASWMSFLLMPWFFVRRKRCTRA